MDSKYSSSLEKVVIDMLQYSNTDINDVFQLMFETILKAEQSEFLDYLAPDSSNKRNGYRTRLIQGISDSFHISIPRDRQGNFKPFFLELLKDQRSKLDSLAFKLYCKGLTDRDIASIFEEFYGPNYSKSSVSRLATEFTEERKAWQTKSLNNEYLAVLVDALWLPVCRGSVSKEAFYVMIGLRKDFTRDILSVWTFPEESASGWKEMLQDVKNRGVEKIMTLTSDGLTGMKEAIRSVFPSTSYQRCIVHKERNVLTRVRHDDKKEVALDLKVVFNLNITEDSINDGKVRIDTFLDKWAKKYPKLLDIFPEDELADYFTYVKYPYNFRRMIYTTNWVESLNKKIRRTTKIRNSFPNEDSALNLVCACLMDLEENNYHKYKVTSLNKEKDKLIELINEVK